MNAAVIQEERWRGWVIDHQFALLDWLGGSTDTAVFRTELAGSSPQPAAIKLIRADGAAISQQLSRWKELAALSHPHLLRIIDSGHCQILGARWLYIVTEYGDENLEPVLQVRALSLDEAKELVPPVLETLKFLHSRGLVHGRIKPSNIFAVKNQLRLSSDGIQSRGESRRSRASGAYDAPEAESGVLSPAGDIWSLGMMLVAAFNQRPVAWARSSQTGPKVPKSVPSPYSRIASECLRLPQEERCSLDRIGELVRAPSPAAEPERPPAPPRRRSFLPLGSALAVLLLVISIAVIGWRARRNPVPARREPAPPALAAPPGNQNPPAQPAAAERQNPPALPPAAESQDPPAQPAAASLASTRSAPADPDRIVQRVVPDVPLSARETIQPVEGKVRVKVRVSVDETGQVASASLVSEGPSPYFRRLALAASRKWRFAPVTIGGNPATSEWLLEYRFGRQGTEVNPVELH